MNVEQIVKDGLIFGLKLEEITKIKHKLDLLDIDLSDLITFLDRDKVQLFAEQNSAIKELKESINKAVRSERESCAELCKTTGAYTDELEMALMCADAIRDRS